MEGERKNDNYHLDERSRRGEKRFLLAEEKRDALARLEWRIINYIAKLILQDSSKIMMILTDNQIIPRARNYWTPLTSQHPPAGSD